MATTYYTLRDARPFTVSTLTGRVFAFAKITSPQNCYFWITQEVAGTYAGQIIVLFAISNRYWFWNNQVAHYDYIRIKSSTVNGGKWTVVFEGYRISGNKLETIQAVFNASNPGLVSISQLSSTTSTDTARFLNKTITRTSGDYTCLCTLSVESNKVFLTLSTKKTATGEVVFSEKTEYYKPRIGGTIRVHDYNYIVEEKNLGGSSGYQTVFIDFASQVSIGTKKQIEYRPLAYTRYSAFMKGANINYLGQLLFSDSTLHDKTDEWLYICIVINQLENKAAASVFDRTGEKLWNSYITVPFDNASSAFLTVSGEVQELFCDNSFETDDSFIRTTAEHQMQIYTGNNGLDASRQWLIVNAKDPTAVDSNAFYCKKEPAVPVGFVYIQFPGEKSPQELFGCGTWQNVTAQFAGAFFRAEGGNASAFGAGLQDMMIQSHGHSASFNSWVVTGGSGENRAHGGLSNSYFVTGLSSGIPAVSITATGGAETRPINYTIRIWKRTA